MSIVKNVATLLYTHCTESQHAFLTILNHNPYLSPSTATDSAFVN